MTLIASLHQYTWGGRLKNLKLFMNNIISSSISLRAGRLIETLQGSGMLKFLQVIECPSRPMVLLSRMLDKPELQTSDLKEPHHSNRIDLSHVGVESYIQTPV